MPATPPAGAGRGAQGSFATNSNGGLGRYERRALTAWPGPPPGPLASPGVAAFDVVFLDRDGTINEKAPDGDYVSSPGSLRLLPGAAAAIAAVNASGADVVVVTNQRGVALGRMSARDVLAVNDQLDRLLAAHGARVDAYYVCPHEAGSCDCRKPLPGLVLRALADRPGSVASRCVLVGDAESDVEAGLAAGTRAVRLAPEGTPTRAEVCRADLAAAVAALLGASGGR